ncbi:MAG: NAD(+) synthase [Alistipes sp.]|nr:NAD(+) synthase [Alistipes sp.]MBR6544248.1 NAD(+) synthase [Alistipes sp.]
MNNQYGYIRVAAAVPRVHIADARRNAEGALKIMEEAFNEGVEIVVMPELSLVGYTCGDMVLQNKLLNDAEQSLAWLMKETADIPTIGIVGLPVVFADRLYNCAAIFGQGQLWGIVPKSYIPNYGEFSELRWWVSGYSIKDRMIRYAGQECCFGSDLMFDIHGVEFGVEICEDMWVPVPPSSMQAVQGAKLLFNLSASPESVCKHDYLISLIAEQSSRTMSAYIYASSGHGESSSDLVFAGNAVVAELGRVLGVSERFVRNDRMVISDIDVEYISTRRTARNTFYYPGAPEMRVVEIDVDEICYQGDVRRHIEPIYFVPEDEAARAVHCREVFAIQSAGLAQRLEHTNCKTVVMGISGGLDSTLALLAVCDTYDLLGLDRKGIIGVTMPGFGTTDRTYQNAVTMIKELGCTLREISIKDACEQHFKDIGLNVEEKSVAYENSQARERTQILMDVANMCGGMVVGTGDMSELALGWATYNGDQMSMYGINSSVPKTLVKHMVDWYANNRAEGALREALLDVVATPISPELLPHSESGDIAQKTEDVVGPYELHDFFLYCTLRRRYAPAKIVMLASLAFEGVYDKATIIKWLKVFFRRFFSQQFKRSAMPDGPKVGGVGLSPRGDLHMPSDAQERAWLQEVEDMERELDAIE